MNYEHLAPAIVAIVLILFLISGLVWFLVVDRKAQRECDEKNREAQEQYERDQIHARANGLPPPFPPNRWVREWGV